MRFFIFASIREKSARDGRVLFVRARAFDHLRRFLYLYSRRGRHRDISRLPDFASYANSRYVLDAIAFFSRGGKRNGNCGIDKTDSHRGLCQTRVALRNFALRSYFPSSSRVSQRASREEEKCRVSTRNSTTSKVPSISIAFYFVSRIS